MFGIGVTELGIILVVALLVFGPKRLPELARTLGRGMGEFRRASHELRQSLALDDIQNDLRRDLNRQGPGTIHKPQASEEPQPSQEPQAPGAADPTDEQSPEPSATSTPPAPGTAAASPHPGEIPLGNDHEHHDAPAKSSEDESVAATERSKTATPAHPGLGNVPVAGADPADPERG